MGDKNSLVPDNFVAGIGNGEFTPPPGVIAFWGYLGPAATPAVVAAGDDPAPTDRWRLYFNLHLTEYVEFQRSDVVWFQTLVPDPPAQLSGTVVWLDEKARVQFVHVATLNHQANFLRGPIASIPGQRAAPMESRGVAAVSDGCGSLSTPCND